MKIIFSLNSKYNLHWMGLTIAVLLFLVGCQPRNTSDVDEKIPDIISIANAPELQPYVLEFSKPVFQEPIVAVPDRKEPATPVDHSLIQGKVFSVDHDTNCSSWLIQSYVGSNWWEHQKLYVYSGRTKELQDITTFAQFGPSSIDQGFVVSVKDCAEPLLIISVSERDHCSPWADEIWTYINRSKEKKRVSAGGWIDISPDRSIVTFWKSSKENFLQASDGFHCLYLWDLKSNRIEPIISMWESDPGSGTSWNCRWSADSEAVNIKGNCGGFYRNRARKYTELNLIYLVKDKKFYSVK